MLGKKNVRRYQERVDRLWRELVDHTRDANSLKNQKVEKRIKSMLQNRSR